VHTGGQSALEDCVMPMNRIQLKTEIAGRRDCVQCLEAVLKLLRCVQDKAKIGEKAQFTWSK
jgi:hypothetical protein